MKSPRRGRVERTRLGLHAMAVLLALAVAALGARPAQAKGDVRIDQGPGARYNREDPAMGVPDQPDIGAPLGGRKKDPPQRLHSQRHRSATGTALRAWHSVSNAIITLVRVRSAI
jgi:hypothetical protein